VTSEASRAALILSGGFSTRMGRDKGAVELAPGLSFRRRAMALARVGVPRESIFVVSGAHNARDGDVINSTPEQGMFSSIRAGLTAIHEKLGAVPTLLMLIDHPYVEEGTVARLWMVAEQHPGRPILPVYHGKPGHPVVLPGELVRRVASGEGERLDALVRAARPAGFSVSDPGIVTNVNRPGELQGE